MDDLPPLDELMTWKHRPEAIAKCCISDIHRLKVLANDHKPTGIYLLDRFPCETVEVVGLIVEITTKEKNMFISRGCRCQTALDIQ
jgi:hypothetical protein